MDVVNRLLNEFNMRTHLLIATLFMSLGSTISNAAERPNFVVIMADDLGYGDLSCYGGWIQTPTIDRIAAEGVRFTDFHSNGAVCSPTRAALMTGRYQQRAGIPGVVYADPNRGWRERGLQVSETTFAEVLSGAGYQTAMFGKWHVGYLPEYNPVQHGFDVFKGYVSGNVDFFTHVDQAGFQDWWQNNQLKDEPGYVTHLINQHSVDFINNCDPEQPFCLYVAHEAPHYPYQGPNDKAQRWPGKVTRPKQNQQQIKTAYRQMVEEMDTGIGQILEAVRRRKIERETIVFFFSDNGGTKNGSNGVLRGHKGQLFEGGQRVPAVVSWPGHLPSGWVCDQTAITMDIMPTLLDFAELEHRPALDGVSLKSLILQKQPLAERSLFWQFNSATAMRKGPWKLVKTKPSAEPELFHLKSDLSESHDVANDNRELADQMNAELGQWMADVQKGATVQP